jgi:hypothetical protein
MTEAVETSWWLDWSGLPDRLLWARLRVFANGSAEVLDLDGRYHYFGDRQAAVLWLNEDEYTLLEHLVEDGEVGLEVFPPTAGDDAELVRLVMLQREGDPC